MVLKLVSIPTQPSLVYIVHTTTLSLNLYSVLCLLLGTNEQNGATLCGDLGYCLVSLVNLYNGLLQVDDVDTVSLGEDVRTILGFHLLSDVQNEHLLQVTAS